MNWNMSWTFLLLAIIFETIGTSAMKMSQGFTKLGPAILMVVCYVLCFSLLTLAIKQLDVSLAYAIWSGLGTALITIIGIYYFHEKVGAVKIISILLIIIGVIGLHLSANAKNSPDGPQAESDGTLSQHAQSSKSNFEK
jgi:small multidrug resistance pump